MKQTNALNTHPIIAVVDDHPLMLEIICRVLESKGFYVALKLSNGQELLNTLSRTVNIPKIYLLDIQMSAMNGLHTLKKLRELYPGIKTVVYSFTRNKTIIHAIMECDAEGYLFKGCSLEELLSRLNIVVTLII